MSKINVDMVYIFRKHDFVLSLRHEESVVFRKEVIAVQGSGSG